MKIFKKIVIAFVALLVLLALIGFMLPAQTHVERSVVINAPAETVYPLLSNFHEFNRWSPWAQRDPETQYQFEGPESGVGAKMSWASEHPQVGSGSQEITEAEANRSLTVLLDFGDHGVATARYTLAPVDNGVEVTWSFESDSGMNLIKRYFCLMMDKWVGADYEAGLASLKALAESMPVVVGEEVSYSANGVDLKGYLAYTKGAGPRPGVLVVHEWWGHNEYARKRARQLAELGYTAFALDMFGDGKMAHHPDDAMALVKEATSDIAVPKARFDAALEFLKGQSVTDAEKTAAIGYCFGGSVVLSMARLGADLDGVVSFHGGLQGLAPIGEAGVTAKALVLNGEADPFVSAEHKESFKAEMDAAGVAYEFIDYPGALHSFTNPEADEFAEKFNMPLKYDAEADKDSWQRMQAFFTEIFQ